MVEFILRSEDHDNKPFEYSDIENYYIYPELGEFEGGSEDDKEEYIEELEAKIIANHDKINDLDNTVTKYESDEDNTHLWEAALSECEKLEAENDQLNDTLSDIRDLDSEPQEVYEWYMVSSYLLSKLSDYGHPVISSEYIWGRGATGQAILLDHVITKICANMEILHGQSNSWAK